MVFLGVDDAKRIICGLVLALLRGSVQKGDSEKHRNQKVPRHLRVSRYIGAPFEHGVSNTFPQLLISVTRPSSDIACLIHEPRVRPCVIRVHEIFDFDQLSERLSGWASEMIEWLIEGAMSCESERSGEQVIE